MKKNCFYWLVSLCLIMCGNTYSQSTAVEPGYFLITFDPQGEHYTDDRASEIIRQKLGLTTDDVLILMKVESDAVRNKHQRFQHYYRGVKIVHDVMVCHSTPEGIITSISGEYHPAQGIDTTPQLTESEALELAKANIGASSYMWESPESEAALKRERGEQATYFPTGELVIIKDALAWKFDIYAFEPESRDIIYVHAQNGAIVHKNNVIKQVNGQAVTRYSGTQTIQTTKNLNTNKYELKDGTRGQGIETYDLQNTTLPANAIAFSDMDNNWTKAEYDNADKDNTALDAHWGMGIVYDYWKNVRNRNSYDDNGAKIIAFVHYDAPDETQASWDGYRLRFTDGGWVFDGKTALDVIGHEFGHAVCDSTANLDYSQESGAINESLSDVWAACIDQYVNTNPAITLPKPKNVWLFEDEIKQPVGNGNALRSLLNPNKFGQPDTYWGNNWDLGGEVHTNSGVGNYWFYLLAEPGLKTGTNDHGINYSVQGIGIDKASQIVYHAESHYLTPTSAYANYRAGTIQSVTDLFQNAPDYNSIMQNTIAAWDAVWVGNVPLPVSYCIPASVNNNNQLDNTKLFQLKNLKMARLSISYHAQQGYYFNPSTAAQYEVFQGRSYRLSFKPDIYTIGGNILPDSVYCKVWADFNRDGIFDEASEIVTTQKVKRGTVLTSFVNIPMNASYAGKTRMRIAISQFSNGQACDNITYGMMLDYEMQIYPYTTGQTGDGYCMPIENTSNSDRLSTVKVGSLNVTVYDDSGYGNYYYGNYGTVTYQTLSCDVVLKPKDLAKTNYWKIWVDYNADKSFSDSEIVFQSGPISGTVNGLFNVPANATVGKTRMRIQLSRGEPSIFPDACSYVEYGQILDFPFEIKPSCAPPASLSTTSVEQTKASLKWDPYPTITTFEFQYKKKSDVNWILKNVSGTTIDLLNLSYGTTYEARIRSFCTNGFSAFSPTISFTTLYCTSKGLSSTADWIDLVSIGTLNNVSGNDGGYKNYTNLPAPNVQKGATNTIQYSAGSNTVNPRSRAFGVWIDFNQDGDYFEGNELVVLQNTSSLGTVSTSFTVPVGALAGKTGMRVSVKYGNVPFPCETFDFGEVEDYIVNIVNSRISFSLGRENQASEPEAITVSTEDLKIYPNPASQEIHVVTDQKFETISIADNLGRIVYDGPFHETLNVQDWPSGVYFLCLKNGLREKRYRFIKQ